MFDSGDVYKNGFEIFESAETRASLLLFSCHDSALQCCQREFQTYERSSLAFTPAANRGRIESDFQPPKSVWARKGHGVCHICHQRVAMRIPELGVLFL